MLENDVKIIVEFVIFFILVNSNFVFGQNAGKEQNNSSNFSWDFGKVNQGKNLTHSFLLVNATEKPFKIEQVITSCECTKAEAEKEYLSAGESTLINVTVDTKDYLGLTQQNIYVYVGADDPYAKFIITMEVIKE